MFGGSFTAIHHTGQTEGVTYANALNLSEKQNITNEMTVSIVGYDRAYDLYITAPSNTKAPMIKSFWLNVSSPGNSTVDVYFAKARAVHRSFSWHTVVYLNTTLNGTVDTSVVIQSSKLGLSRTVVFVLTFMTVTTYVKYETQKINEQKTQLIPLSSSYVTYLFGGIIGILSVGAAIARQRSSRKGWTMKKDSKKKIVEEQNKGWRRYFGI